MHSFIFKFRETDFFADLIAKACIRCVPDDQNHFDIEHIRVSKILGGALSESFVLPGLIVVRKPENPINKIVKPRILAFNCPLDTQNAETKGTILLKNAKELLDYTKGEENLAEKLIQSIKEKNIDFIVVGGTISELVLHYLQKYNIACLKVTSKFEFKRICKAVMATPLTRLGAPVEEEIGYCDEICVEEISSEKVTVFRKDSETCKLTTIVLRGSTMNLLDDIERAIDDGVNCYRCMLKDPRFVYGAGANEIVFYFNLAIS